MKMIYFPRWMISMMNLEDVTLNTSTLAKKTNTTYSHITKLVKELESAGLVQTIKKGRTRVINLTENGKIVREMLLFMRFECEIPVV